MCAFRSIYNIYTLIYLLLPHGRRRNKTRAHTAQSTLTLVPTCADIKEPMPTHKLAFIPSECIIFSVYIHLVA